MWFMAVCVQLVDKGTWRVSTALLEYTDALWNCDEDDTLADYEPRPLTFPTRFSLTVSSDHDHQLERHHALPPCGPDSAHAKGRCGMIVLLVLGPMPKGFHISAVQSTECAMSSRALLLAVHVRKPDWIVPCIHTGGPRRTS